MRNLICKVVMTLVLGSGATAWAAIDFTDLGGGNFRANSLGSQVIPDAPSSGLGYALNFNSAGFGMLTGISFTFTTTGGWNGDLYAYLSHGSGFAVLLNKVGASSGSPDGYGTSGFNTITLAMGASTDIHGVATPTTLGGPYAADGRLNYADTTRANTLSVFNGADPNGSWTLYFGDLSSGDQSTLTSWSVNITAVPEPVNVTLVLFGVLFAGVGLRQWRVARRAGA